VLTASVSQSPTITANAASVNQVVPSPNSTVAFVTYKPPTGATGNATLPYYVPGSGTAGYLTLNGASEITAPLTGAFTPDGTLFFVGTAGDNLVHYIDVQTLKDTQQIAPNLPACTPGADPNCVLTDATVPASGTVPVTAITVKPRSTT